MTYIYTRHAEKPKPVAIHKDNAQGMVDQAYCSLRYASRLMDQLTEGKIDHIAVRDGTITVEK